MNRLHRTLDNAVLSIEWFVVAGLVFLSLAAAWTLTVEMFEVASHGFVLDSAIFNRLIGTLLEIFILIELFRIAMAYMAHQNVVPTVLEAALVAVARKFVVFESADNYLLHSAGLASLLLAVAISWWLLSRAHACDVCGPQTETANTHE